MPLPFPLGPKIGVPEGSPKGPPRKFGSIWRPMMPLGPSSAAVPIFGLKRLEWSIAVPIEAEELAMEPRASFALNAAELADWPARGLVWAALALAACLVWEGEGFAAPRAACSSSSAHG